MTVSSTAIGSRPIRRLLRSFSAQPGVTPAHVDVLTATLINSRLLAGQLDEAVRAGQLEALVPLPADSHAGGSYNTELKIISLPLPIIAADRRAELIFVLGHEVQHALNRPDTNRSEEQFFAAADLAGRTSNDYTAAIQDYLDAERRNEARANLSGWNALADHVRGGDADAAVDHVALESPRCQDFVTPGIGADLYAVRPGLTINSDLTFDLTPANVEAMGRYYFDKAPEQTRIGHLGTSDYRNQYGSGAVSQVAASHRYYTSDNRTHPIMIINATRLGLSRKIMEENGIDLAGEPAQPFLDCSNDPPRLDFLHHTIATHQFVPVDPGAFDPGPRDDGSIGQGLPRPVPGPSIGLELQRCTRSPRIGRPGPKPERGR